MPQTDWYATKPDNAPFLDALFSEPDLGIYELSSAHETPLRRLTDPAQINADLDRVWPNGKKSQSAHYSLHFEDAGVPFQPRRHSLNPQKCHGATWREAAHGWHLVRLDVGQQLGEVLYDSSLFLGTTPRMIAEGVPEDAARLITRRAARLTRLITAARVAKLGRHSSVLPGAAALWERGHALHPFKPGEHADYFSRL